MPLKMGSSGGCVGRRFGESRRNSVHERPKPASRGRFRQFVYTPAHPRSPQRRNSVHKCPETASRGRFSRSVYTLASPQSLARLGGATGPTTPTAPWPRATQVFGPEARPIGAVTQPPTHTNSRSLSKCGSHHIFYLYNVIQITFWKGWNGQRRSKELGYLAGVAPS